MLGIRAPGKERAFVGWDQKGDKRAPEREVPDILHFLASWVAGMDGLLPRAHPERTCRDLQPPLLPRLNPFLPWSSHGS